MDDRAGTGRPAASRGAGLISMSAGLLVFLLLLGFTVQFMFHLSARSVVHHEAAAVARAAAGYRQGASCEEMRTHIDRTLRERLGGLGGGARIVTTCTADLLRLDVRVRPPTALPAFFDRVGFLGAVERTVEVRLERLQP